MRSLRTVLLSSAAAFALAPTGCEWLKNSRSQEQAPKTAGPIPKVQTSQLVAYLNQQADALSAVSYNDVKLSATEAGRDFPTLKDCTLAAAQPRNFRLVCGTYLTSQELDLGSNGNEFWMYAKRLDGPNYFFCSHDDFDRKAVNFPVPFDPDWVMMALGMTRYNPADRYTLDNDEKRQLYWLKQQTTTRQGQQVTKSTAFNVDYRNGKLPVVCGHLIEDQNGKAICAAKIEAAHTEPIGIDPVTQRTSFLQVPTKVVLQWPQQKFTMELTLAGWKINDQELLTQSARASALFSRPQIRGTNPIDLARYQFTTPTARGQAPGETKSRRRWWQ